MRIYVRHGCSLVTRITMYVVQFSGEWLVCISLLYFRTSRQLRLRLIISARINSISDDVTSDAIDDVVWLLPFRSWR